MLFKSMPDHCLSWSSSAVPSCLSPVDSAAYEEEFCDGLPGQVYSIDDVCRSLYGAESYRFAEEEASYITTSTSLILRLYSFPFD